MSALFKAFRITVLLALLGYALSGCSLGMSQREQENAEVTQGVDIQRVVMAEGIGQNNAPVQETNTFSSSQDYIYVVAQVSRIDQGTTMFARWSRDGQPFEDSDSISADRAYQDTYVEFHLENLQDKMETGNYSVQLFVNGNPAEKVDFQVE